MTISSHLANLCISEPDPTLSSLEMSTQPFILLAVLFQKLSIADYPLYLRLLAGPDTDVLSFVLKENETGEVEVCLGPLQKPVLARWVLLS